MWWLGRKLEDLFEEEKLFVEYEAKGEGILLWHPFNSLLHSSTRCELAAAILAMMPGVPMHIDVDNLALVKKGNAIIEHIQGRAEANFHGANGH